MFTTSWPGSNRTSPRSRVNACNSSATKSRSLADSASNSRLRTGPLRRFMPMSFLLLTSTTKPRLGFRRWVEPREYTFEMPAHQPIAFAGRFFERRPVDDTNDSPPIRDRPAALKGGGYARHIGARDAKHLCKRLLSER